MKQKFPEPTVGALIVNKQGKLLLVKSPKWFDKYTIPGGHVELGEDLKTALVREVKEEVSLDIEVQDLLDWQEAIYSKEFYKPKHFIFFDFYCPTKNTNIHVDRKEITNYIWVKPRAKRKLNIDKFTQRTMKEFLRLKKP